MSKTIKVPLAWLEGLLHAAKRAQECARPVEEMSVDELKAHMHVVSLLGYIESVDHIVELNASPAEIGGG